MKRGMTIAIAAFVALLAGGVLSRAVPAAAEEDRARDVAAIRKIVEQVQQGWNAHDSKAFAAPFAENADYVVVNGMHIRSRKTIDEGHARIFATIYKDSKNAAAVKSIRFLRPDVALAHVEWNLEYRLGGETQKNRAMNSLALTKDDGQWSIAAFHNTPILPANG